LTSPTLLDRSAAAVAQRPSGTTTRIPVPDLRVVEIKAFVPAKDFALSKRFYRDIGFTLASDDDGVAYFRHGDASFLLQDFFTEELAGNFMMHLLVEDVDAWHRAITDAGIAARYGVEVGPVELQPWRMRDFVLFDPSGVLWRIAQNVPRDFTATS
jgi:catechol 2,3-dioxygenase-like lactoylglutathione lyase family enzyme